MLSACRLSSHTRPGKENTYFSAQGMPAGNNSHGLRARDNTTFCLKDSTPQHIPHHHSDTAQRIYTALQPKGISEDTEKALKKAVNDYSVELNSFIKKRKDGRPCGTTMTPPQKIPLHGTAPRIHIKSKQKPQQTNNSTHSGYWSDIKQQPASRVTNRSKTKDTSEEFLVQVRDYHNMLLKYIRRTETREELQSLIETERGSRQSFLEKAKGISEDTEKALKKEIHNYLSEMKHALDNLSEMKHALDNEFIKKSEINLLNTVHKNYMHYIKEASNAKSEASLTVLMESENKIKNELLETAGNISKTTAKNVAEAIDEYQSIFNKEVKLTKKQIPLNTINNTIHKVQNSDMSIEELNNVLNDAQKIYNDYSIHLYYDISTTADTYEQFHMSYQKLVRIVNNKKELIEQNFFEPLYKKYEQCIKKIIHAETISSLDSLKKEGENLNRLFLQRKKYISKEILKNANTTEQNDRYLALLTNATEQNNRYFALLTDAIEHSKVQIVERNSLNYYKAITDKINNPTFDITKLDTELRNAESYWCNLYSQIPNTDKFKLQLYFITQVFNSLVNNIKARKNI